MRLLIAPKNLFFLTARGLLSESPYVRFFVEELRANLFARLACQSASASLWCVALVRLFPRCAFSFGVPLGASHSRQYLLNGNCVQSKQFEISSIMQTIGPRCSPTR